MSTQSNTKHFDTNSNPNNGISICIPRVFSNLNWRRIRHIFIQANLGFVERVDVVNKGKFKTAYVHFGAGKWNMRSYEAREFLNQLQSGKEVQFLYDDPWFWKVSISNAERPSEAPKPKKFGRKPTLDLTTTSEGAKVFKPVVSSPKDVKLKLKKEVNQKKQSELDLNDPIQARVNSSSPKEIDQAVTSIHI
tara:strand:+ start:48 stop:623 length:576 start_codon:yes stop_codon:yes gene_type:complete